jgi:hypothetical protein
MVTGIHAVNLCRLHGGVSEGKGRGGVGDGATKEKGMQNVVYRMDGVGADTSIHDTCRDLS